MSTLEAAKKRISAAYEAAKKRQDGPNGFHQFLDERWVAAQGRYKAFGSDPEYTVEGQHATAARLGMLETATEFFEKCRDEPANRLGWVMRGCPAPVPVPVIPPTDPGALLNRLEDRGITVSVFPSGSISLRPGHKVTDMERKQIAELQAEIAVFWRKRNDVLIFE